MSNTKQPILQLDDVSKIYQVGTQTIKALEGVDFSIKEGEFVSVIGSSGSGKSTFLQVASILAEPSKGKIFLKGKDVTSYNEVERAKLRNKEIGFIFQQFNLLPRTSAIDNVALPLVYAGVKLEERRSKAIKALTKLGLGERLDNKPNELSGGQQQRVAIARALVNNPSIIFADEPTGNLDSKSGAEVEALLKELHKQGSTIILVTHEKRLAKIAQRIIELKDGVLIKEHLPPFNKI
ncbi:MAG: Cell division transporter, ATP-binding protein FtsE [Microgenomates bacterium 39_7]|nr:MAG: Cell division transporter, ATP-binding protein FtsE [Microgenomates bacterium 39_7]